MAPAKHHNRPTTLASAFRLWLVLLLASAAMCLCATLLGGTDTSPASAWNALLHRDDSPASTILWQLRIPRVLAAYAVGGLLALSGALMQVLVRNPLADPYTLGLSGGAAVGALGAMLMGAGAAAIAGGAAAGALAACLAVFVLAHRDLLTRQRMAPRDDSTDLVLIGVMLAAGFGAIVSMMLVLAPDRNLRGMLFWMMGDLSGAASPRWPWLMLVAAVVSVLPIGRPLNLLARGEEHAAALGVRPNVVKSAIFAVASLATAVAVTTAGTVGFVGLVVPHALRRIAGNDQRVLLPASALGGGLLVVLADTVSRVIADPIQLPVGAVMAVIGVPTFLYMLVRRR